MTGLEMDFTVKTVNFKRQIEYGYLGILMFFSSIYIVHIHSLFYKELGSYWNIVSQMLKKPQILSS